MAHDEFCDKYAEGSTRECWACKAIAEARADEREKAAQRLLRVLDSLIAAAPHHSFVVDVQGAADLIAVVGGEQE